jgi:hypothetical protein
MNAMATVKRNRASLEVIPEQAPKNAWRARQAKWPAQTIPLNV